MPVLTQPLVPRVCPKGASGGGRGVGVKIASIVVGERSRRDLTKIDSLAASIERVGLIQPPVVREIDGEFHLVCGQRRIEAMKSLGWTEARVTVAHDLTDELAALLAEGEENTEREPFTATDAVAHRRRIRDVEAALAKARQSAAGRKSAPGRLAETSPNLGEVIEPRHARESSRRAAKATGYSATTLDKAEAIVDVAEDPETPEPVREVAQQAVVNLSRHGAKVDAEKRRLDVAMERHVAGDANYAAAKFRAELTKHLSQINVSAFDVDRVIEVADDLTYQAIDAAHANFTRWHDAIDKQRRGLRVLKGGAQ